MRQRLGHGKAPFVGREALEREDDHRDPAHGGRASGDGIQRMTQALVMMIQQFLYAPRPIGDQPLMPGQGQPHIKLGERTQRIHETPQGIGLGMLPSADIRRDLHQHMIAAQHEPIVGVVED